MDRQVLSSSLTQSDERQSPQFVSLLPSYHTVQPTRCCCHLDPFSITYPTAVQTSLHSQASFARFDPTGRFVAAGLPNGSARIWDLGTKSTVRWLEGHVKGVTSVEYVSSRYRVIGDRIMNLAVIMGSQLVKTLPIRIDVF